MIFRFLRRMMGRTLTLAVPLISAVAIAQAPVNNTCATIVREALQAANNACSGTSRNEVCYGNILGAATPADGVTDLVFENIGDIARITQIKALQLSPFSEADNQWGVALMQLQATLPDTLPGQNVTFLMFGDVTIEDNTGDQVRIDGSVIRAANLRLSPTMTGPILGSLPENATIVGTGKAINNAGELWVRLRYEDYRTKTGWMLASLIDIDLEMLPDVAADSLTYSPMQAFYFKTGIGQTQCADVPANGVLVQTPEGAGKVNFNVNGVDIAVGSTILLTAPEGESNTCLSLISGDMDVRSNGKGPNLNPGERVCVPTNTDGSPGEPGKPEPFDLSEIASVSVIMESLPIKVEIPDPAPVRTSTPIPQVVTPAPTTAPQSTDETPTELPPDPTEVPRTVSIQRNRSGTTITFSAVTGPDPASDFEWTFNSSSMFGQSIVLSFSPGEAYTLDLKACWTDDECITTTINASVPACAVASGSTPIQITFLYSSSTDVFHVLRSNDNCEFNSVGTLGPSPNLSSITQNTFAGNAWQVTDDAGNVIWSQTITPSSPPITVYVPM